MGSTYISTRHMIFFIFILISILSFTICSVFFFFFAVTSVFKMCCSFHWWSSTLHPDEDNRDAWTTFYGPRTRKIYHLFNQENKKNQRASQKQEHYFYCICQYYRNPPSKLIRSDAKKNDTNRT